MTENHFFESLDACFIGIDQNSNEPLTWTCAGLQVQQRFELPIPSLAGSVCKYSFSTLIGDIAFSVEYRCKGRQDEKIFGNSRVPSDLEPISGTFKSVREGTLLFIFDNSFSWYNPKILTYKIELYQVRTKCSFFDVTDKHDFPCDLVCSSSLNMTIRLYVSSISLHSKLLIT
jgi:hypothetical protein